MIPTQNELKQAYANAPKTVQEFITSTKLERAFAYIYLTHHLHLDEADALARALNAVFLDRLPFTEFPAVLKKEVLTKNGGAYDAALADIKEKIFAPFREQMKNPEGAGADEARGDEKVLEKKEGARHTEEVAVPFPVDEKRQEGSTEEKKRPSAPDPYREPIE